MQERKLTVQGIYNWKPEFLVQCLCLLVIFHCVIHIVGKIFGPFVTTRAAVLAQY